MSERRGRIRKRLSMAVRKFRQKGATTPETARTVEELGLPPEFRRAMGRRLGKLGVFVEIDGKYYLSEKKLRQVKNLLAFRKPTPAREIIREKEITVVKIRCRYCGALNLNTDNECSNCGANL